MKATGLTTDEPKIYALIFDKGDEVVKELTAFAKEHRLASAHFTAIGALSQVTLGYFDRARKDYTKIPTPGQEKVCPLAAETHRKAAAPKFPPNASWAKPKA